MGKYGLKLKKTPVIPDFTWIFDIQLKQDTSIVE